MNRNKPRERLLFACLLVAFIIGIVAVKLWVVSVEERLALNLAVHWNTMQIDQAQNDVLKTITFRLLKVEHTAWATWDHHAPCDGWPTQQQIAQGER